MQPWPHRSIQLRRLRGSEGTTAPRARRGNETLPRKWARKMPKARCHRRHAHIANKDGVPQLEGGQLMAGPAFSSAAFRRACLTRHHIGKRLCLGRTMGDCVSLSLVMAAGWKNKATTICPARMRTDQQVAHQLGPPQLPQRPSNNSKKSGAKTPLQVQHQTVVRTNLHLPVARTYYLLLTTTTTTTTTTSKAL
jgi:hypothetical protein